MVGFCRGAACYALRRKAHNESIRKVVLCFDTLPQLGTMCRLLDYPFSTEWWGPVGAQHATPCAVRRIMNRCEKRCCVLTHPLQKNWDTVFCRGGARKAKVYQRSGVAATCRQKRYFKRRSISAREKTRIVGRRLGSSIGSEQVKSSRKSPSRCAAVSGSL